jgi:hypothetical protein
MGRLRERQPTWHASVKKTALSHTTGAFVWVVTIASRILDPFVLKHMEPVSSRERLKSFVAGRTGPVAL